MEEIMVLIKELDDTFIQQGTAKNQEEARKLTIELLKNHLDKNKK